MNNVVQLEAFESSIKARRLCWYLVPNAPALYPPGFQEQIFTETPPFQRRILLTHRSASEAWKLTDKWDAILLPTTPTDWSLILTILLNQPTPSLVMSTPGTVIPSAFFQKCSQQGAKAPTIVVLQTLGQPLPVTFDAVFFPPAKSIDESLLEATQLALQKLLSSETLRNFSAKDALKDLRGAGATLVVSSIEEVEPSLYWYYASEPTTRGNDLLASVVQTLLTRGI